MQMSILHDGYKWRKRTLCLQNRKTPDIELDKYFQAATVDIFIYYLINLLFAYCFPAVRPNWEAHVIMTFSMIQNQIEWLVTKTVTINLCTISGDWLRVGYRDRFLARQALGLCWQHWRIFCRSAFAYSLSMWFKKVNNDNHVYHDRHLRLRNTLIFKQYIQSFKTFRSYGAFSQ